EQDGEVEVEPPGSGTGQGGDPVARLDQVEPAAQALPQHRQLRHVSLIAPPRTPSDLPQYRPKASPRSVYCGRSQQGQGGPDGAVADGGRERRVTPTEPGEP